MKRNIIILVPVIAVIAGAVLLTFVFETSGMPDSVATSGAATTTP